VEAPTSALVFCRTRVEVDQLAGTLAARGYRPEALHGGMSQEQRDRVMRLFRNGTADLLVATDVAARGLDIDALPIVVNFELPHTAHDYVHRIGRTGRAGAVGEAISLVAPEEEDYLKAINRLLKRDLPVRVVKGFEPTLDGPAPASPRRGRSSSAVSKSATPRRSTSRRGTGASEAAARVA